MIVLFLTSCKFSDHLIRRILRIIQAVIEDHVENQILYNCTIPEEDFFISIQTSFSNKFKALLAKV